MASTGANVVIKPRTFWRDAAPCLEFLLGEDLLVAEDGRPLHRHRRVEVPHPLEIRPAAFRSAAPCHLVALT